MDDSQIIDLYLARDENAITQTKIKYGSRLLSLSSKLLNDSAAAEECENDTYLEAWNLIPPNEPRTYMFAFLGRIIRHISIDRCRRNSALKRCAAYCELTREMEECIPGEGTVDEAVDAAALARTINTFLSGLSREQRNIFVRRYWYFETVPEICRRYGFSQSKVNTKL